MGKEVAGTEWADEGERRRGGLRMLLGAVRKEEGGRAGERAAGGLGLLEAGLFFVMLLAGVGVVRGLLTDFHYFEGGEAGGGTGVPCVGAAGGGGCSCRWGRWRRVS